MRVLKNFFYNSIYTKNYEFNQPNTDFIQEFIEAACATANDYQMDAEQYNV